MGLHGVQINIKPEEVVLMMHKRLLQISGIQSVLSGFC